MKKRLLTVATSAILGTLAYIKVKRKNAVIKALLLKNIFVCLE